MRQNSYDGRGTLYLIPTPIGNLDDITIRGLNTLKLVDLLLCEDTRVTGILLKKFNIKKKLLRCDEYMQEKVKDVVIDALKCGKMVGLVSDAGSPVISDPGYKVVSYVINGGYNVVALPGATAFVPALISSGILPAPFTFIGFLNSNVNKQRKELEILKDKRETLIFYEAPHRIEKTLKNMLEFFGDRQIAICREISKRYEEIIRGSISECLDEISNIKGEIVIVVTGNKEIVDYSDLSLIDHVNVYLSDGLSEMDAIKKVAKERKVAKSIIYKQYLNEKGK